MKILATIWKESILLVRDLGGMSLIFLMPLALVIVMALIQDNSFEIMQESRLEVLFVDEDADALGQRIAQALQASPNIHLIKSLKGRPLTAETAERLVRAGDYKAALIIPEKASITLRKKVEETAGGLFAHYGFGSVTSSVKASPPIDLQILFDPAIKPNYRQALTGAVEKMTTSVQATWLMDDIQRRLGEATGRGGKTIDFSEMIHVRQNDASSDDAGGMALNAVQHNVPAWSMFAMFFILFPLAGNFIKEREEGSMLRLRLISGSQSPVIAGKFLFYLGVCLLQLVLMIGVGLYVMPLFGLSKLALGANHVGIVLTGLAVAMAATGYGLLIAVYFITPQQALSFGAISVVILAAIGGVWVPVFAMSPIMQKLSPFSPLNWGLSAFNHLFLRSASTAAILPDLAKLLFFSCATLAASLLIHRSRIVL